MSTHAIVFVLAAVTLLSGCVSTPPTGREAADWYYPDWMANAPYAPTFQVLDTESSLGPYATRTKTITLKDLVKMHGHPCDGLVTAACALSLGLRQLYPDGVADRTDTACISNNSPCFGDVAAYLTGGRIRFGTQKVDPSLGNEFIVYRISTKRAIKVALKPSVFPAEIVKLEGQLRGGAFTEADLRRCQKLQWDYARTLLSHPLNESFTITVVDNSIWQPDPYLHRGERGDVIHKNFPNRTGVEQPTQTERKTKP